MNNYAIITCSTADISPELLRDRDVDFIQFSYYLDGKEYLDDMGISMTYEEFYKRMKNGAETKTSLPNKERIKEKFLPYLKEGKDIICLMLSSGLSGAMTSASMAKEELNKEYPERKIYVVDSLGASTGMGLLTMEMAKRRDEGMPIDELYSWTEQNKLNVHHWFFTTDLTYFVKGGRVSKLSGWFGTILKICPLLNVSNQGKLIPRKKLRGKAKAIEEIVKRMEENAASGINYDGPCYISHSDAYEDAVAVKAQIEGKFPNLKRRVSINSIGTTIGSHTGPGTVAVFFFGSKREN